MRVLDCESVESTYDSLESILDVKRSDLEAVFDALDIEKFYQENRHYDKPAETLLLERVTGLISPTVTFDAVCWFHLTRTNPLNAFEQGILPLGQQITALWKYL